MAENDRKLRTLRRRLLRWFARHRRDMPWRGTRDPYAVWVAEIMLQQTQVATVRGYYTRFLRRFPSVAGLARATRAEVLKAWEGLGYYSRARHLHRAARQLLAEHDGRLPEEPSRLMKLPGIGRYTAGAIASIAFGRHEPVLDGNVTRVLCRVFRIRADPKSPAARKRLWGLAGRLVEPGRAAEVNEALMDLGATVCVPRLPDCGACPLAAVCEAFARGEQAALPRKAPARPVPHHTVVAGVIRRRGRILIDRRPAEGLLGGLWEFPGGKVEPGESLEDALRREVREEVGIDVEVGRRIAVVRHAYSHFRITLHAFECRHAAGRARAIRCEAVRWVWPSALGRYAFPRANARIIAALQAGRGEPDG